MQELETVLESKQRLDNNREVTSLVTDAKQAAKRIKDKARNK